MKAWKSALADVVAVFPGGIYVPEDVRNGDATFAHSESLAAIESPYLYELDYLPARYPLPVVTVGGVTRDVVAYNPDLSPSAGQVAISFTSKRIEWASADAAAAGVVAYTATDSAVTARLVNQLQRELAAVQGVARASRWLTLCAHIAAPAVSTAIATSVHVPACGLMTLKGIWICAADRVSATGNTTVHATMAESVGGGGSVTITSGQVRYGTAANAIAVDATSGAWINLFVTAAGGHQNLTVMLELEKAA